MIKKRDIERILVSILLFFYLGGFVVLFMRGVLGMTLSGENNFDIVLVDFSASLIITIFVSLFYFDIVKGDLKKLKEKFGDNLVVKFLKKVFIAFLIMNLVKYVGATIVVFLEDIFNIEEATVDNQALIETLLGSAPAMMIISVCIFAPIEEELIFRGAIRKIIKNKKVFITVSGLIFGLMHVTDSLTLILELLLLGVITSLILCNDKISKDNKIMLSVTSIVVILLVFSGIYYFQFGNLLVKLASLDIVEVIGSIIYISMGVYLAYLYVKEDNIYMSIGVHALNNLVSVIVLLFLQ